MKHVLFKIPLKVYIEFIEGSEVDLSILPKIKKGITEEYIRRKNNLIPTLVEGTLLKELPKDLDRFSSIIEILDLNENTDFIYVVYSVNVEKLIYHTIKVDDKVYIDIQDLLKSRNITLYRK